MKVRLLASCYRAALALAERHRLAHVAFPAISTGIFRFPLERATTIALTEMRSALQRSQYLQQVTCVCFDEVTLNVYASLYAGMVHSG